MFREFRLLPGKAVLQLKHKEYPEAEFVGKPAVRIVVAVVFFMCNAWSILVARGGSLRFSGVSTSGWGLEVMSEYPFVAVDNAESGEKAFLFQASILFPGFLI